MDLATRMFHLQRAGKRSVLASYRNQIEAFRQEEKETVDHADGRLLDILMKMSEEMDVLSDSHVYGYGLFNSK